MEQYYSQEERYVRAKKRVKSIVGFYTHLIVSVLIIPFIIFVNLDGSPQFHWYWFFIAAWFLGVAIHWIYVFGISKWTFKKEWERKKIEEIIGENTPSNKITESKDYLQKLQYLAAKKRVQEVKGFYVHFMVTCCITPVIIWVNFQFVPGFHFFWYAVGGMTLSVLFHWFGVFGVNYIGFGKDWEHRKIQQFIKQENFKK